MALITCPECGHEVSEHATSCPQCGYPLIVEISLDTTDNAKKTSLTKPAGCFLQAISTFIFVMGLALLVSGQSFFWGGGLALFGGWLFVLGGKPARQK